jgi:hypothetical protein
VFEQMHEDLACLLPFAVWLIRVLPTVRDSKDATTIQMIEAAAL